MFSGLFSTLGTGGPVIVVLLVLSLISFMIIIVKSVQLLPAEGGKRRRREALAKWKAGDRDNAQRLLAAGNTPVDRVVAAAMSGTMKGIDRAPIEAEVEWLGNEEVETMARNIRLLDLIAMIAPLLGLLGTVLGMIESFQQLELAQGAANASILAGGIWQALLTTAAGLIVAIPAAVAGTLFAAKVDSTAHSIEATVSEVFRSTDAQFHS
jgi:biopolymer transport protein ExbB